MSTLPDEEIYQELGKIIALFKRLECFECAQAILNWLKRNRVQGILLRLRTKYRDEFIVSSRCEQSGSTESISTNGVHYGVEVRGKVFDNLSNEGLSREAWINDFACRRGVFVVGELEQV